VLDPTDRLIILSLLNDVLSTGCVIIVGCSDIEKDKEAAVGYFK
jgi:hypothetical protein